MTKNSPVCASSDTVRADAALPVYDLNALNEPVLYIVECVVKGEKCVNHAVVGGPDFETARRFLRIVEDSYGVSLEEFKRG